MQLAILTIRKELHGFLFLCIRVVPFSIRAATQLEILRMNNQDDFDEYTFVGLARQLQPFPTLPP